MYRVVQKVSTRLRELTPSIVASSTDKSGAYTNAECGWVKQTLTNPLGRLTCLSVQMSIIHKKVDSLDFHHVQGYQNSSPWARFEEGVNCRTPFRYVGGCAEM